MSPQAKIVLAVCVVAAWCAVFGTALALAVTKGV